MNKETGYLDVFFLGMSDANGNNPQNHKPTERFSIVATNSKLLM
jgi:hypothetical protein